MGGGTLTTLDGEYSLAKPPSAVSLSVTESHTPYRTDLAYVSPEKHVRGIANAVPLSLGGCRGNLAFERFGRRIVSAAINERRLALRIELIACQDGPRDRRNHRPRHSV